MTDPFGTPDHTSPYFTPHSSDRLPSPNADDPFSTPSTGDPFDPSRAGRLGPFDNRAAVRYVAAGSSRPTAVHVAFYALLIAALGCLVLVGLSVSTILELDDKVDTVLNLDPTGMVRVFAGDYVDDAETSVLSAIVALGVVFAVGYLLVAMAVRRGRAWPRPVGTALAVLSLPAVVFGPVAVVIVVAGVVAVIALWTVGARQHVAQGTTVEMLHDPAPGTPPVW